MVILVGGGEALEMETYKGTDSFLANFISFKGVIRVLQKIFQAKNLRRDNKRQVTMDQRDRKWNSQQQSNQQVESTVGCTLFMIVQMERFSVFTVTEMISTHTIRMGISGQRVYLKILYVPILIIITDYSFLSVEFPTIILMPRMQDNIIDQR